MDCAFLSFPNNNNPAIFKKRACSYLKGKQHAGNSSDEVVGTHGRP